MGMQNPNAVAVTTDLVEFLFRFQAGVANFVVCLLPIAYLFASSLLHIY
jgi:hypothetical protein